MKEDIAISVNNISKLYKLYEKPSDRLRDALGLLKKERYSEKLALDNVSLNVRKGETVGIIGTNGSGKSTLLKIITGVLNPSGGSVSVDGHISALLELGAGFNMEYNGIDNIYLNGMMIGFSEDEIRERLQDILDFADIGEYVYQPVKTYSSGMFVRLAFAVAINIDPEILIVDEALSVGDVFFQAKCYHKFEEFKQSGKTILLVSHDLSSINKYCDRAVLLNRGTLIGEGSPKEMIDVYKQILVGLYPLPETSDDNVLDDDAVKAKVSRDKENGGKNRIRDKGKKKSTRKKKDQEEAVNPSLIEYGNGKAKITGYHVLDAEGRRVNTLQKGEDFTVYMKVRFKEDVKAPIFAFTIKNSLGIEITGTNSMVEKAFAEPVSAGEEKEITFKQTLNLQGGDYLLSFGVTGFEQNDFMVYHRLYDALSVSVISDKNTVGFFDMGSAVEVRTCNSSSKTTGSGE